LRTPDSVEGDPQRSENSSETSLSQTIVVEADIYPGFKQHGTDHLTSIFVRKRLQPFQNPHDFDQTERARSESKSTAFGFSKV